jgi:hypothetical protein
VSGLMRTVPFEPTVQQREGLARDIVMWLNFDGRPTGKTLYQHLRRCGVKAPDWLKAEVPDIDHVPPKGTIAAIIYKAMLEGYETPNGRFADKATAEAPDDAPAPRFERASAQPAVIHRAARAPQVMADTRAERRRQARAEKHDPPPRAGEAQS